MYRFLLLLSSSVLLPCLAQAQGGVRVGVNLMGLGTKTWADGSRLTTSQQVGYQVGYYYRHHLTKRLTLVPEAQFSREQAQVTLERYAHMMTRLGTTFTARTTQSHYHLTLSYVNLPVLVRFALGSLYLEAGPQVSVLVGGQGKGDASYYVGDASYYSTVNQTASKRFRPLDVGACVGVGLRLPAGFGVNIRAYQGVMNRDREEFGLERLIPWVGHKTYRQTLQAGLSYQWSAPSS